VQNAVDLYPTSGTSDDWAYSRHFLDENKGKVRGFTIEWGPARPVIRKSFHPDYQDMVPIIEEVTAGLLAFCATLGVPTRAAALGVSSGASRQTDQTATVTG
jgi:hypothetical protein